MFIAYSAPGDRSRYLHRAENFARAKFVAGGLPADRVVVKPNFLQQDPGPGTHQGDFALFVGRLSAEKGIAALVRIWSELAPGMTLRVMGSGPLEKLAAARTPNIQWLGQQTREQVLAAMKDARFLVFLTEWYEGFPMVLLEAMATGLPVVASRLGSLPEILQDGTSGVLVPPSDTASWLKTLQWTIDSPEQLAAMGRRARQVFEARYAPEVGYRQLADVYRSTLERTHRVKMPPLARTS